MRTYEAMCVFRAGQEAFNAGVETVRAELVKLDAEIEKEEDMGVRPLAFPIKKQLQAHYYYYVCKLDPEKAHQIENAVRLKDELLRFLMVRRDD
ncbi:MAG: 30S ribosomal protein S6 [Spirochaetales bacterium]|nr:30S ribosomal protein S6 [Spirochaetales bacterium]